MGLFNSIQDLIGGVSDAAAETASNAFNGLTEPQVIQDLQENATNISDTVTGEIQSMTEGGQTTIDQVRQNISF